MAGTSIFFLLMESGLAARRLGCMLDMYSRDFRHRGTAGPSSALGALRRKEAGRPHWATAAARTEHGQSIRKEKRR